MSSAIASQDVDRIYEHLCGYWDTFNKAPLEDEIMHDLGLSRRLVMEALGALEDAQRLQPGTLMPMGTNAADDGIPF